MRIGIVGKGYFGKKIASKLQGTYTIAFITGRDYKVDYNIDWVIISSSNSSHFEIAKDFLSRGINVFCEKPLTLNFSDSVHLYRLADEHNCRLYVDDVFRYTKEYIDNKADLQIYDGLVFDWNKFGSFTDSIYSNLTYHDLYLLVDLFGSQYITNIHFSLNESNRKAFSFKYGKVGITLRYNRLSTEKNKRINGIEFSNNSNDALKEMLDKVLTQQVDFGYNKFLSLSSQELLEYIQEFVPKVAVVGGGIFGISAALELDKAGFAVTLIEKNSDILQNASGINQYRLHRGYHYPRSKETALACESGNTSFLSKYDCLSPSSEHYYCIASQKSVTTPYSYKRFMKSVGLKFEEVNLEQLNNDSVDLTVKVYEHLFDPNKLEGISKNLIKDSNIKLQLNTEFKALDSNNFNYVVNCTYSNYNSILSSSDQEDFQFELCEKPVVKLPEEYSGKSIVIMDGPFTCIDPLGDTDLHLVGNVVHAIHCTNVGKFPTIPEEFKLLLNKGIVKNPTITNIDKFIESGKVFFKDFEKCKHIGSMYTIRTVLPRRDHDDARPTIIKKHNQKVYSLFSGKIATCVDTATELTEYILKS